MNYTKPDDKNYEDSPNDWLFGALLFAKTLGFVLKEHTGIIIDLNNDLGELYDQAKRVIVYNDGKRITVLNADERTDLSEGSMVNIIMDDEIKN